MRVIYLLRPLFLLLFMTVSVTYAQQNSPQTSPTPNTTLPPRLWQTSLSNGAMYTVRLDLICSISLQKYISRTAAIEENGNMIPLIGSAFGSSSLKPHYLYADVTELTIDTIGGNSARFYSVSPHVGTPNDVSITLLGTDITDELKKKQDQLQQLQQSVVNVTSSADSQGNQAGTVIKDYPYTTHAKNAEFKLTSDSEVQKLYQAALSAWSGVIPRR
ncbi:MAG: hypothetical protein ABIP97_07190 [Chthoniobacterales bacterium]